MNIDDRHYAFESARHNAVIHEIRQCLPDSKKQMASALNQYGYLLTDLTTAARDYAECQSTKLQDFESHLVYDAIGVVSDLRLALTPASALQTSEQPLDFWHHARHPLLAIQQGRVPYIDRNSVEVCVGRYLDLPYRCQSMDRFLVIILAAIELYAFGDEMLNEKTYGIVPHQSPIKQPHVFWRFVKSVAVSAVALLGLAAVSLYSGFKEWIGTGWAWGVAALLSCTFILSVAIGLVALPNAWASQRKSRERVRNLMDRMIQVDSSLRSGGPISARHIREQVDAAAVVGVIWPAPLYVLLDDILERGSRL